jgi:hypothetical protein
LALRAVTGFIWLARKAGINPATKAAVIDNENMRKTKNTERVG